MLRNYKNKKGIGQVLSNRRIYHPIVKRIGENWYKTTLKEDGFTFEDNLINTFTSLQALDCVFDEESFWEKYTKEVPLNEFLETLRNERCWLRGFIPYTTEEVFYCGEKRYTCKPKDEIAKIQIYSIISNKKLDKDMVTTII